MATTYDAAVASLRAHWQAHDNKQPRSLVLSTAQHDELTKLRRIGLEGLNVDPTGMDAMRFMGVPIEVREGEGAHLIAADGTAMPLEQ